MKPFTGRLNRYGSVLLFPLAMVIYDFSAYLTTDLIQPGIIHIIRELQADITLAPVIGPLAGAGLMSFMHWKLLFAIIGGMSLMAWALLMFKMPETVKRRGRSFHPEDVLSDFIYAFRHPVVLTGALALSFGNLPMITWVALSPVILIEDGGMSPGMYAWTQVPVFGGVIIASIIVANFIKAPTSPRFIWRTVPIQLSGLCILLLGNLGWPYVWLWSVMGISIYALGIGMLYPSCSVLRFFLIPCLKAPYQQPSTLLH